MECKNCGFNIPENVSVCPSCGAQVVPTPDQAPANQQPGYQQPVYQQPQRDAEPSMKWYKFLAYFAVWASAVGSVATAVMCFTGSVHLKEKDRLYALSPTIKTVDVVFGVLSILLAVFAIYVGYSLLKYKKNAPVLVMALLAVEAIVSAAHPVIIKLISGDGIKPEEMSSVVMSVAIAVVLIIVNKIYFDKRKHLFVN